jgi:hypothetical protein
VRGFAGLGAARNQRLRTLWAGWPRQGRKQQQQRRLVKLQSGRRELERGVSGLRTGRASAMTTAWHIQNLVTERGRHASEGTTQVTQGFAGLYVPSRGRVYTDRRRSVSACVPLRHRQLGAPRADGSGGDAPDGGLDDEGDEAGCLQQLIGAGEVESELRAPACLSQRAFATGIHDSTCTARLSL